MTRIFEFIVGTPPWIYAALAVGIGLGVRAFKQRRSSLRSLFLLPTIFIGFSLFTLAPMARRAPFMAAVWAVAIAAGGMAGAILFRPRVREINREGKTALVPGTPVYLPLILTVFLARYFYTLIVYLDHRMASSLLLSGVLLVLSAAATGIVGGRTAAIYRQYFDAETAV